MTDGARTSPAERLAGLMVSDGPREEFAEAFASFAPLIGSWDLEVKWYDDAGEVVRETKGEWHFAWALDGRAVADIWITPSRAQRAVDGDGEWGLTIRLHDPELGAFRSTWMGPKHAMVMTFIGHPGANSITLEAREPKSAKTRWIFTDITPTSFHWRNEDEAADGTITVRQRFTATRSRL
ncbi:hypothetical protein EV644_11956 [Kribbella orskensis]|uniref:DUF1579 domain-containing protein n=1 Tax=Kribbella orskensis TaxID=2512216 RepID=A0ABY2BBV5_9ACTN|nr:MULTISPECIES: hypothetical protein [Kribbella]TCN34626.1 hypothetical protein EV642_12087 [Kribbella sp. VKM Ac-2500]TCO14943.1 hypothetical protein EV644_11956 [Kribbella orskensis]